MSSYKSNSFKVRSRSRLYQGAFKDLFFHNHTWCCCHWCVIHQSYSINLHQAIKKKKGRIESNCAHTRMRTHVQSWKVSLLQFVCGLSSTSLTATIPVQHRLPTRYTTGRRRTQWGYLGYANRNIIIIVIIISESQFMQSFNVFNLLAARVLTVVTLSYTLMEAKPLSKWRAFISATLYKTHAACTKKRKK